MTAAPDKKGDALGGSPERIAKRMARAGLCSRRDAERWIAEGRVTVDGEVLTTPAVTVTANSRIEVDGKPLPTADAPRLFRFHKPTGYLTAARDPEGRKTIADLMPVGLPRLMPIGRLDMNSEGLLLLTNDGALKRQLELPSTGWQRRYRVRVHGDIDEAKLASLARGITIDGFDYGPIEAHLERTLGKNAWLTVALREGKNREIRKVMEHFGWPVNRLIRVSFGPFHLGNLAKKEVDEIKAKVVKEQIGFVLQSTAPAVQRKRRLSSARPNRAETLPPTPEQGPGPVRARRSVEPPAPAAPTGGAKRTGPSPGRPQRTLRLNEPKEDGASAKPRRPAATSSSQNRPRPAGGGRSAQGPRTGRGGRPVRGGR
jgi:23S rRNA pseudouridine2605 synthase